MNKILWGYAYTKSLYRIIWSQMEIKYYEISFWKLLPFILVFIMWFVIVPCIFLMKSPNGALYTVFWKKEIILVGNTLYQGISSISSHTTFFLSGFCNTAVLACLLFWQNRREEKQLWDNCIVNFQKLLCYWVDWLLNWFFFCAMTIHAK